MRSISPPRQNSFLELVPADLKKPELTADWEMKLVPDRGGTAEADVPLCTISGITPGQSQRRSAPAAGTFRHDNLTNTKCPVCGKRMLKVKGKNAEMLVCQDRECGHRETIARTSNATVSRLPQEDGCSKGRETGRSLSAPADTRRSCPPSESAEERRGGEASAGGMSGNI